MGVSWLRVFRVVRILKALHVVEEVKELRLLLGGFKASMKAMFFGGFLILFMLVFFSIFIVQFLHPVNTELNYIGCDRCSRGFRSVMASTLTLFQQIVAGDSWGEISIPVIEENPAFGLLLPFTQLAVGVGAMNLVLAVIVERAMAVRESSKEEMLKEALEEQRSRLVDVIQLLRQVDTDGNGMLSKEEIEQAWVDLTEFKEHLFLSGVSEPELFELVSVLDSPGGISYLKLGSALDSIVAGDVRKMCLLSKCQLSQLTTTLREGLADIKKTISNNAIAQNNLLHQHERLVETLRSEMNVSCGRGRKQWAEYQNGCSGDISQEVQHTQKALDAMAVANFGTEASSFPTDSACQSEIARNADTFREIEALHSAAADLDARRRHMLKELGNEVASLCHQITSNEKLKHIQASYYTLLHECGALFVKSLERLLRSSEEDIQINGGLDFFLVGTPSSPRTPGTTPRTPTFDTLQRHIAPPLRSAGMRMLQPLQDYSKVCLEPAELPGSGTLGKT